MLTVAALLEFRDLGLRNVAGAGGQEREVTWATFSELADPTPFLQRGDLLLTAGRGLGRVEGTHRSYVRRLAKAGVAGVVFALGVGWSAVPPALCDEADRQDLPVLTLDYEVPFAAVTRRVFSLLGEAELDVMRSALEFHDQLVEQALKEADLHSLLSAIGNRIECNLRLLDVQGNAVAVHHVGGQLATEALSVPLTVAQASFTLEINPWTKPLDDGMRLLLRQGQSVLALALSRRLAVVATELRLIGDLIPQPRRSDYEHEKLRQSLIALGLDPLDRYSVMMLQESGSAPSLRVQKALEAALQKQQLRWVSGVEPNAGWVIVAAAGTDVLTDAGTEACRAHADARVGIGSSRTLDEFAKSVQEARLAIQRTDSQVSTYKDLACDDLLMAIPTGVLKAYVNGVLGQVEGEPELINALCAFVESGERWVEAADRLAIHRHTLRSRLERLKDLTGRDLGTADGRLTIWMAVRAREILGARTEDDGY